jgi:hypothetical protein
MTDRLLTSCHRLSRNLAVATRASAASARLRAEGASARSRRSAPETSRARRRRVWGAKPPRRGQNLNRNWSCMLRSGNARVAAPKPELRGTSRAGSSEPSASVMELRTVRSVGLTYWMFWLRWS